MLKNWRDYEITSDEADEMEVAYIVFEEDVKNKYYDLTKGIFSNLEAAKEYAEKLNKYATKLTHNYVAIYRCYVDGSYDYL